jgi:hypothetical protein
MSPKTMPASLSRPPRPAPPPLALRQRKRPPPARWIGLWTIDPPRVRAVIGGKRRWTRTFFFVSYSRADSAAVRLALAPLQEAGYVFWLDKKDLPVGGHWSGDIVAAIRAARAVLLFCSANAFASNDVYREVSMAGRCNKFILPVFIDSTPAPDDFLYYLSIHQAVRIGAPDWRAQLARALDEALQNALH